MVLQLCTHIFHDAVLRIPSLIHDTRQKIVCTMPLPDAVPISSIIYVCPILSFSSAVSIGSLTVLSDEDSVNTAFTNANSTQTTTKSPTSVQPKQEQRVPIPSFCYTIDSVAFESLISSAFTLDGSVGSAFTIWTQTQKRLSFPCCLRMQAIMPQTDPSIHSGTGRNALLMAV